MLYASVDSHHALCVRTYKTGMISPILQIRRLSLREVVIGDWTKLGFLLSQFLIRSPSITPFSLTPPQTPCSVYVSLSFKQKHMGISEPMHSGCFLLSTSILAVQTVKHASPPSASDHFHQGKGVWSKQEDVAGWLPSALRPPHSASLLLLSNLILFWPGPLGIWLTIGYQDPHCVVMSLWPFLFTITLYVPLIPFR